MRIKRHVIRPHRPVRNWLIIALAVLCVGAVAYPAYVSVREITEEGQSAVMHERDELKAENKELRAKNGEQRERLAILERAKQVEGKAYADVDQHLRSLQDEVLALKEEVAFYRGIVSPQQGKGLNIQTFVLEREGSSDVYRFQLVLTQNIKSTKVVAGTVNFSVAGEQEGLSRQLSLGELSESRAKELEFQFKYFQRLEGRFVLPKGFMPHRVYVQLTSSGKRPKSVEKTFDWLGLVS